MALNPINPVLRSVRYDAVSAAKVELSVQPGEVLEVSDDIAGQLVAQSAQFKTAADVAPEPEPEPEAVVEVEAKPVKRRARKV